MHRMRSIMLAAAAPATASALPEGTILSFDKSLLYNILIQSFNVAVLIAVLIFFLYKPVRKFLEERKQRISDEITHAQRTREEAELLLEKYKGMIAGVEAERDDILVRTEKIAIEKSDRLLFEARREAEMIHQRAKADVALEYKNMEDEIKRQIIDISHLMAGRFVEVSIDQKTQDRLIEQALAEWDSGGEFGGDADAGGGGGSSGSGSGSGGSGNNGSGGISGGVSGGGSDGSGGSSGSGSGGGEGAISDG